MFVMLNLFVLSERTLIELNSSLYILLISVNLRKCNIYSFIFHVIIHLN